MDVFDSEWAIVPGDADDFFFREVGTVDGIFRSIKKSAWSIFYFFFDPFSFEDDDRFGGERMAVGGNGGAWGELSQEEAGATCGIVGEGGEFDTGVRTGLPEGGVGETEGGKHEKRMRERIRSDNLGR